MSINVSKSNVVSFSFKYKKYVINFQYSVTVDWCWYWKPTSKKLFNLLFARMEVVILLYARGREPSLLIRKVVVTFLCVAGFVSSKPLGYYRNFLFKYMKTLANRVVCWLKLNMSSISSSHLSHLSHQRSNSHLSIVFGKFSQYIFFWVHRFSIAVVFLKVTDLTILCRCGDLILSLMTYYCSGCTINRHVQVVYELLVHNLAELDCWQYWVFCRIS